MLFALVFGAGSLIFRRCPGRDRAGALAAAPVLSLMDVFSCFAAAVP